MEKAIRLPGSEELETKWEIFRKESPFFSEEERQIQVLPNGQKTNKWGFCISEILPQDSIFFLGLNPSAPEGDLDTGFGSQALALKYFRYHCQIARGIGLDCAYWDVFPIRQTKSGEFLKRIGEIAKSEKGRAIISAMFEMTRQALEIARPKAVVVCNRTIRELVMGKGKKALRNIWQTTRPLLFSQGSYCELPLPNPKGKRKFLYYSTMKLQDSLIPVLLATHLNDGHLLGKEQAKFAIEVLQKALADPERYYAELSK